MVIFEGCSALRVPSLLLISSMVLFITLNNPVRAQVYVSSTCSKDTYFSSTASNLFRNNRDSLFESFSTVSNDISVFNTTKGSYPDEIYGMFICKDRISAKTCKNCVTTAITQILVKCPLNKHAIIWFDNCFIQYSNKTTFSSLEKHPSFISDVGKNPYVCMSDQDRSSQQPIWFKEQLLARLDIIAFKATNDPSNRMYAEDIIETGLANFSGTVQCKFDLPQKDCFDCVSQAADRVQYCLAGKNEGIILAPNCSTRYELNPSWQVNPTGPPAPAKGENVSIGFLQL